MLAKICKPLDEVVRRGLPDPWLVGWSFGTDVVLRHGDIDPVQGAVLLSPPDEPLLLEQAAPISPSTASMGTINRDRGVRISPPSGEGASASLPTGATIGG